MSDLISRQAAIDETWKEPLYTDPYNVLTEVRERIQSLPTAGPTLYGYKIEHLAYIATVMEKEGVTAEYAVRTFDDIERVIKMIIEEAQAKVEEVLNERLISRQAAIDAISLFFDKAYIEDSDVHKNDALYELNLVPSAEKKGKWILVTNGRGGHECDQCHEYAPSWQTGEERLTNYCPNCGARME